MPQMWILMDNSFRVNHKFHICLDKAKNALTTYPPALLLLFSFFKDLKNMLRRFFSIIGKSKSSVQVLTAQLVVMAVD